MDKVEAYSIIQRELDTYKKQSFSDLTALIGSPQTKEVRGESSTLYQLEVQVNWDDKEGEDLRVVGAIDSLNWYAFSP